MGVDKAIVNTITSNQTKYAAKVDKKHSLTYQFKQPVLVRGYGLRAAENPDCLPDEWSVKGSVVNIHTGERKGEDTLGIGV